MSSQQRNLFADADAPWEDDDARERLLATVVLSGGVPGEYDYVVPERLRESLQPGCRVHVPFGKGNHKRQAYCVAVATRADRRANLKELGGQIDARPLLSPAMLRVTRWIGEYYLCPLGQVLEAVIPAGVRQQAGTKLTAQLVVPENIRAAGIDAMILPRKQKAALQFLADSLTPLSPAELARAVRSTVGPIHALKKKGLVQVVRRRTQIDTTELPAGPREEPHALNADQQQAVDAVLDALRDRRHETILLHGVTGSGKTEVYMRAIDEVLEYGRQAIVLVPEISLTPQTTRRFRSRFGSVAVLHSHLTDVERHRHWQRIAAGEVQVVVGARSAVFAPAPHLGLIVIDEEHEASFKQETAPRYHARDVALRRAADEQIPLLLGSATPSLESWHRAQSGEWRLLKLPKRVLDRPLPAVDTIDMRDDVHRGPGRAAMSRKLTAAIEQSLADGGQVILLLNRRGFSTHIQCPACGMSFRCPQCEIALTYHRHGEIALCHLCDFEEPAPRKCPKCEFRGIKFSGLGTQQLEAEVKSRFPDVPCARMDSDAMQKPGSHERVLEQFRHGELKILLGTQMIAKGLDFPDVTLVGVINADTALNLPDFRSAERTFQLLAQVAGRTGRGERGGRVLVQTLSPDHPAIRAVLRHDYEGFTATELPMRAALHYPPFGRMVRIVVRGPAEEPACEFARAVTERLKQSLAGIPQSRVLGPAACPVPRLRGMYRYQIHAHAPAGDMLRDAVRRACEGLETPADLQWIVDVDPLNMM